MNAFSIASIDWTYLVPYPEVEPAAFSHRIETRRVLEGFAANGTQVLASRSSHRTLADASGYDASEFRDSGCHKLPIGSAS
jgi:hypothetical protein